MINEIFDNTQDFCVAYSTPNGLLVHGDSIEVLPKIKSEIIDTIFADPPFNLNKQYGPKVKDNLSPKDYLEWCKEWVTEGVRIIKPGGAFFIYNMPKWNVHLAGFLEQLGMQFRHWIAIDVTLGLPIRGRLYPSHYSLLYYTKGKPKTFKRIRVPIQTCRHCGKDIKDYGGHRKELHSKGLSLKDVWLDIPPVCHKKFKSKKRKANALSTKLLERVVNMSTEPGELVMDPFGGSGTTFAVCEHLQRRWVGVEIESVENIVERLNGEIAFHVNNDYVEK